MRGGTSGAVTVNQAVDHLELRITDTVKSKSAVVVPGVVPNDTFLEFKNYRRTVIIHRHYVYPSGTCRTGSAVVFDDTPLDGQTGGKTPDTRRIATGYGAVFDGKPVDDQPDIGSLASPRRIIGYRNDRPSTLNNGRVCPGSRRFTARSRIPPEQLNITGSRKCDGSRVCPCSNIHFITCTNCQIHSPLNCCLGIVPIKTIVGVVSAVCRCLDIIIGVLGTYRHCQQKENCQAQYHGTYPLEITDTFTFHFFTSFFNEITKPVLLFAISVPKT